MHQCDLCFGTDPANIGPRPVLWYDDVETCSVFYVRFFLFVAVNCDHCRRRRCASPSIRADYLRLEVAAPCAPQLQPRRLTAPTSTLFRSPADVAAAAGAADAAEREDLLRRRRRRSQIGWTACPAAALILRFELEALLGGPFRLPRAGPDPFLRRFATETDDDLSGQVSYRQPAGVLAARRSVPLRDFDGTDRADGPGHVNARLARARRTAVPPWRKAGRLGQPGNKGYVRPDDLPAGSEA